MSGELPLLSGGGRTASGPGRARKPGPGPIPAGEGRSVYIETYGCQMNVADTELVSSILGESGYRLTDDPGRADIVLINTCAVREHAEERVLGRAAQLSALRDRNPSLILGILGCMAQRLAGSLPRRAPFVDLVAGPDSYRRLPQILAEGGDETLLDVRPDRSEDYAGVDPARRRGTNAWVTIIRGCDKFCSFCIVPYVRGRERSVDSGEILRQVRRIAEEGFREVTLLGQTVNSYCDGKMDFADLLREISRIEGIERIRFTSPHPGDFDQRLIDAMAGLPQVCPSLHLPVQSGSNAQLERMRRGYTVEEYRDLVHRLRRAIPDLSLTTDVIVGFCGETDEDFDQTCALLEEIRFDSAFMFRYSEREGTYAQKKMADDVPDQVKAERLKKIIDLQEGISRQLNQQWVGRTVQVLVEGPSRRKKGERLTWYGRSEQGKTVVFPRPAEPNTFVEVRIDQGTSHTLLGEVIAS